ncbi:hypothetical protein AB0K43_14430 [Kitasatospora sp. NPDC049258]|uniref:hypothetical protein n=1 Tax=Kitasatospora sp. NPDC049258 TaxID=3155394 RepID=UPI003423CD9E
MADSPTGGEWWRVGGRVLGAGRAGGAAGAGGAGEGAAQPEESVYTAEVPAPAQWTKRPAAAEPERPAERPVEHPAPRPQPGGEDVSARFPGWDTVRFYPFEEPAPAAVPEPREAAEPVGGSAAGQAEPAAGAPEPTAGGPGLLAGRRPAPLLLVASAALLAGAYTGVLLAMLGGWGAAYLSRGLGDFTKKFAVLGIPLICMTGASVWFWGRAQGRWGTPDTSGTPMGEVTWAAAPGVLRVAAVLTALFLLALTLRRRREP